MQMWRSIPVKNLFHKHRPLSVGGNVVELEDRTMGLLSMRIYRLNCSVMIFVCAVLQFTGCDITSERRL